MTEDKEWSLKGKGVWKDYQFKWEDHWYSASDIETLREKLIEDFTEEYTHFNEDYIGTGPHHLDGKTYRRGKEGEYCRDLAKKEVTKIINRRFGINED